MGVLNGTRVVELAGIGPGPFCGLLLADMGADVILVEHPRGPTGFAPDLGPAAIVHRGKRSVALDLKQTAGKRALAELAAGADALIEGMRPGVMERLGAGPDDLLRLNPRLVYGRATGWGQHGPLASAAGHDLNYIGLSGALWFAGAPGNLPVTPATLLGDVGGGALYLALGIVAALLHVKSGGTGQVIDAAIVDGSAHMMNLLLSVHAAGLQPFERGRGLLDGPHWVGSYACADGKLVCLSPLEPQFNALLWQRLGLADDPLFARPYDPATYADARERLRAVFASRPRQHWIDLLEGSDACFAPVLDPQEAQQHPHLAARHVYAHIDGLLQAAPAPRFSATPSPFGRPIPVRGAHTQEVMAALGWSDAQIAALA